MGVIIDREERYHYAQLKYACVLNRTLFSYANYLEKMQIHSKPFYINKGLYLNNKKRSHTQLDFRKQVIAFQDRVITINIKEAQHPLKREKQVIDKSSIMLKISTKSMHRVLV